MIIIIDELGPNPVVITEADESAVIHEVCCITDDLPMEFNRTFCGEPIDDDGPIEDGDQDCVVCHEMFKTDYCPVLGKCPHF